MDTGHPASKGFTDFDPAYGDRGAERGFEDSLLQVPFLAYRGVNKSIDLKVVLVYILMCFLNDLRPISWVSVNPKKGEFKKNLKNTRIKREIFCITDSE